MKTLEIQIPLEQNVTTSILLLLLSITCSAQKVLEGKYVQQDIPFGTYSNYTFQQQGGFEYHGGGDLGDDFFGKGTYKISGDTLFLDYNVNTAVQLPYHKAFFWRDLTDSVTIEIQLMDIERSPIGYANVYSMKNRSIGKILNSEGIGRLRLKRIDDDYNITVSSIGYESHNIRIQGVNSYRLEVYLTPTGVGVPKYNHSDTLKILELAKSYLRLKNGNGSVSKWVKNGEN